MNPAERATLTSRCAELYYTYARAVDLGDLDLLAELITDDVAITRGAETEHGREAFLAVYRAHRDLALPMTRHSIGNVRVLSVGEEIQTEAYFESIMFETDQTRILYGVYRDVHVERAGRLRIAHKVLTVDRVVGLPASGTTFGHVKAG